MGTSSFISRRWAGLVACGALFLSFVSFVSILYTFTFQGLPPLHYTLFDWIPVPGIQADFKLSVDQLSLLMTLIITGIGFLIHVYSIGYMDHENDYARFFACMNFFVFAMLLLVLGGNLLLVFVGWEGVGLASYLLIGFYYKRPSAATAATKAFVVNRVGDAGFLIGLLLIFFVFGTSDISEITLKAGKTLAVNSPVIILITLLLFIGATGKSAQIPLHTWLADAMEGPTPVSALIHAATMVTAGVYLIVRMHPLFLMAPFSLLVIGVVGAATSLFAALCALGQTDLKRVLAYSTMSQLGLMFLACGAGAFYAAMFHLTTHAFMKSLLFLSAGNVVHMTGGETNMLKLGGLSKKFTTTHWLFLIGVLAMAGIPPFAAFFSKDLILEQEYLAGFPFLFYIALAASILTGVYLIRAYFLTFWGTTNTQPALYTKITEAPRIMLMPLFILALLCIVGGFIGADIDGQPILQHFLTNIGLSPSEIELSHGFDSSTETWLAILGAFVGVFATAYAYYRFPKSLGESLPVLKKGFYVDDIYNWLFVKPLQSAAETINSKIEPRVIEQPIRSWGHWTMDIAGWLQRFQSGQIRSYIAWMIIGLFLLISSIAF
jgi:NADH-quinone oxidoreductase subunit L